MKRFLSAFLVVAMLVGMVPYVASVDLSSQTGGNAVKYNGHYYKVYNQGMTWQEAKSFCEEQGGHLVTINYSEEQKQIETMINDGPQKQYWIGLSMEGNSYEWVTGEPLGYTKWGNGQPDNQKRSDGEVERYVHILNKANPYRGDSARFYWNDIFFDNTYPDEEDFFCLNNVGFICEWDSDSHVSDIPISTDSTPFDLTVDGYAFCNSYEAFGYGIFSKIPYESYYAVYGDKAKQIRKSDSLWGGNCLGMVSTAALFNDGILNADDYKSTSGSVNSSAHAGIKYSFLNEGYCIHAGKDSALKSLIEKYQLWQSSTEGKEWADRIGFQLKNAEKGEIIGDVKDLLEEYDNYIVGLYWNGGAHAVVIDSARHPEYLGDGWYRFYVYDPNNPYYNSFGDKTPLEYYSGSCNRYFDINVINNHWRMDVSVNGNSAGTRIGYDSRDNYIEGSKMKLLNHALLPTSFDGNAEWYSADSGMATLNICSDNVTVIGGTGDPVVEIVDGEITYLDSSAEIVYNTGIIDGEPTPAFSIELPFDSFNVEFGSQGTAQMFTAETCIGLVSDAGGTAMIHPDGALSVGGTEGSNVDVVMENIYDDNTFTSVNLPVENNGQGMTYITLTADDVFYAESNAVDSLDVQVMSSGWENEYKITNYSYADETTGDITDYAEENGEIVPNDITDAGIDYTASYVYDGAEKTVDVVVKYQDRTLIPGTDYIVSGDISATELGTYTITIVGIGKYTGTTEITYDILPEVTFEGASLTLQDDISVNFKINSDVLEENGYCNPFVKFALGGEEYISYDYKVADVSYVLTLDDIAPDQMTDTINATVYAVHNGTVCEGETITYSITEYCYNMLEQYSDDEYDLFRKLLVDLLNYGAASQTYTEHNMDDLANADLTDEQKTWGTTDAPMLDSVFDREHSVVDNAAVTWKGAGLSLNNSIGMRFKFTADSIENLTARITGSENEWMIPSSEFIETVGGYYVYFNGFCAAQMSEPVYITVYDGDTPVSNTLCYSIESYAYAKQGSEDTALAELLVAMMKYGNSAKAYVDSINEQIELENRRIAEGVIAVIDKIGAVEYTVECKALIDNARICYDSLTDEQKEYVINYDVLTNAEELYEKLDDLAGSETSPYIIDGECAYYTATDLYDSFGMPAGGNQNCSLERKEDCVRFTSLGSDPFYAFGVGDHSFSSDDYKYMMVIYKASSEVDGSVSEMYLLGGTNGFTPSGNYFVGCDTVLDPDDTVSGIVGDGEMYYALYSLDKYPGYTVRGYRFDFTDAYRGWMDVYGVAFVKDTNVAAELYELQHLLGRQ